MRSVVKGYWAMWDLFLRSSARTEMVQQSPKGESKNTVCSW